MAQEAGFKGTLGNASVLEGFLRGENTTGDPNLGGGASVNIGKLESDVAALRQLGEGLGASEAVGGIIDRFSNFNRGGAGIADDAEVSLATEENLLQQSNVLGAIRGQAALLGPGATSALGRTQGEALTQFGIKRANIPTEIRDKFFKQFTPLLQAALGTEAGVRQATIGAEQGVQAFDLGITNQALSNALQFGPIESGRFGQQKQLSQIAAQAQIDAAKAANAGDKGAATAGAAGQIGGSLVLAAALSDLRLKDHVDFIDEEKALEIMKNIHGFSWDWKDGSGSSMGVIAQEVEKIFPQAVVRDPMNGMLMVHYPSLVGVLITAFRAIVKKIDKSQEK